jgi:hypothetical protein
MYVLFFVFIIVVVFVSIALATGNQNGSANKNSALSPYRKYDKRDILAAEQFVKIVNESANIINNTTNFDTFFKRLDVFEHHLDKLCSLEGRVPFSNSLPSQDRKDYFAQKEEVINSFFDRTFDAAMELKTDAGRKKRVEKNAAKLAELDWSKIPENCLTFFDRRYSEFMSDENKEKTPNEKTPAVKESQKPKSRVASKESETLSSDTEWNCTISFGQSTSSNLDRAIYLAKTYADSYKTEELNGETLHLATYYAGQKSFNNLANLYKIVGNWKSTALFINGTLIDKKTFSKVRRCYGDKCLAINSNFCYGASYFTHNPFGCHRLKISVSGKPYWEFYEESGRGTYILNREEMNDRIRQAASVYHYCPEFDLERIMAAADKIPTEISRQKLDKIIEKEQSRYLRSY